MARLNYAMICRVRPSWRCS